MSDHADGVAKAKADIAATRAALAETTAALKVKSDVKTRATAALKANQVTLAAVAGGVTLLIVLKAWRGKGKSPSKKGKKKR